jgi:hypothetical protein
MNKEEIFEKWIKYCEDNNFIKKYNIIKETNFYQEITRECEYYDLITETFYNFCLENNIEKIDLDLIKVIVMFSRTTY